MFLMRILRKRIKKLFALITAAVVALTVGTTNGEKTETSTTEGLILSTTESETTTEKTAEENESTTEETFIILADEMTTINGRGASFVDGLVTVYEGGTYHFKGNLEEGRILVDTEDENEVVLKFYGARINSSYGAPVSVMKAPAGAVLSFEKRTYTKISDTDERVYSFDSEKGDSAVIFSKENLTLTGDGGVNISAEFSKGIYSEARLTLDGAMVGIDSYDDAIRSDGGVIIENSNLMIASGGDGIHCKSKEENKKSDIHINESKLTVMSNEDGLYCSGDIAVSDTEADILIDGGSVGRNHDESHNFNFSDSIRDKNKNDIFSAGRAVPDSTTLERLMEKSFSVSGVSAEGEALLKDSEVSINSVQHGVRCKSISIEDGEYDVRCDGNGIYATETITVEDGEVDIIAFGNGLESGVIRLYDGELYISAEGNALFSPMGEESIEYGSAELYTEKH